MKLGRLVDVVVLVRDLDAAVTAWQEASRLDAKVIETDERHEAALTVGGIDIRLLRPASNDSEEGRQIAARGEGLYSLTVEVEGLETALAELRSKGVSLSAVRIGDDGRPGAMIDPSSAHGVPIRLVEKLT